MTIRFEVPGTGPPKNFGTKGERKTEKWPS